jgi:TM2 domain-containing membrane protein YozV
MNEASMMMRYQARSKSALVAYLLWFFFGWIAAHRLYLGRWMSALLYIGLAVVGWVLTFVFLGWFILIPLGIWWFVDLFLIAGMVGRDNERLIRQIETGR